MICVAWTFLLTGLSFASLGVAKIDDKKEGLQGLFTDWRFLLGFALIAVSIVMRRLFTSQKQNDVVSTGETNLSALKGKIQGIISALEKIHETRSNLPMKELYKKIDKLLSDQIFEIVEAKEPIIALAGYGRYGSFMSDFATGERFISRSWSAAVDGYDEEAFEYIEKAISFFKKAQEQYDSMVK